MPHARTFRLPFCLLLASLLAGCATPSLSAHSPSSWTPAANARPARGAAPRVRPEELRSRAVTTAAHLVGPQRKGAPRDAAGLIHAAYQGAGIALPGIRPGATGVRALHAWARTHHLLHHRAHPAPGDVAFFHDTHDENRDGRRNDPLTHAALVERVDTDGTVVLISRIRSGVIRLRMNLQQPAVRRDQRTGRVLNHYLRAASGKDPSRTAAQLFAGFASPTDEAEPPRVASLEPASTQVH